MSLSKTHNGLFGVICFLGLSLTIQSCIIYNSTKNEEAVCSLHHIKMKKAIVETQFGLPTFDNDQEFPNAKHRQRMGCIIPRWPVHRLAIIYHCRICERLKNKLDLKPQ